MRRGLVVFIGVALGVAAFAGGALYSIRGVQRPVGERIAGREGAPAVPPVPAPTAAPPPVTGPPASTPPQAPLPAPAAPSAALPSAPVPPSAAPPASLPPAPIPAPAPPAQQAAPLPAPPVAAPRAEARRGCSDCPEMVDIPGGNFLMGSDADPSERPVHPVSVAPFAMGREPVTTGQWKECVAAGACRFQPTDGDDLPVHGLSWDDAQQYVRWLSAGTGEGYRLPSEAEWEYAARAGTTTAYWWGDRIVPGIADCRACGETNNNPAVPDRVTKFLPNRFGLFAMGGGVDQWVQDCWHPNYAGAPADGSTWDSPTCREHVLRGGSWRSSPADLRTSSRGHYDTGVRYPTHGLRVARSR
jgi:formylglycine-generating enzyme required for sulfatase activity